MLTKGWPTSLHHPFIGHYITATVLKVFLYLAVVNWIYMGLGESETSTVTRGFLSIN